MSTHPASSNVASNTGNRTIFMEVSLSIEHSVRGGRLPRVDLGQALPARSRTA
jgi:hypothetical protein